MTRKIWATLEAMPFSDETLAAAEGAGAGEIIQLPCPALPQLIEGFNSVDETIVPQVISKFQAKAALLQADLLDRVETLMADPATPALVKLAWAEVQEFRRDSPMIASMATLLGLSSAQVDGLFIAGNGIIA